MSRSRRHAGTDSRHAVTEAREALERRWFSRMRPAPELAELVTGARHADEPFHRWFAYKQAFAPELVRRFLAENLRRPDGPLLDPFLGSGTLAIECARQNVEALGVEALPALAFMANARGAREAPRAPDVSTCQTADEFASRFELDAHRAALLFAEARRHDSDGNPLRQAPTVREALRVTLREMREDLTTPLSTAPNALSGDARTLQGIDVNTIAGVLTSPPYLSRHDYTRITAPIERIFAIWHPETTSESARAGQVRAHPRALRREWRRPAHPATAEAQEELIEADEPKLAGVTRSYFEDLAECFEALARVAQPGASLWIVIGGARFGDAYVPSDLIAAELAVEAGLSVEELRVVRRLVAPGRTLGRLEDVAPRETILILRAS